MSLATMNTMQMFGAIIAVGGLFEIAYAAYTMRGANALGRAVGQFVIWTGAAMVIAGPIFTFVPDQRIALFGGIAVGVAITATGMVRLMAALKGTQGQKP